MRLWHYKLIPLLPRQQLLGQHRECCALRGNGWGNKHATVDYVFKYSPARLCYYHDLIMDEMEKRGYVARGIWRFWRYRGEKCEWYPEWQLFETEVNQQHYPEHNEVYLQECLENLRSKGIGLII